MRAGVILTGVLTAGCSTERVYVNVQKEDGLGMKAPIEHTVRLKVDTALRVVTWMQDSRDVKGVEARRVTTYGGEDGVGTCDVFDSANWSCEFSPVGQLAEAPAMKDGQLKRFYWTDTEVYSKHYRVAGVTLPWP